MSPSPTSMFLLFPLVSRDIMFSHLYTAFLLILTTQRGLDYRALLCTLKALYSPYNQSTNTNTLNKLIHEASNVVAVELDSLMAVSERLLLSKSREYIGHSFTPTLMCSLHPSVCLPVRLAHHSQLFANEIADSGVLCQLKLLVFKVSRFYGAVCLSVLLLC